MKYADKKLLYTQVDASYKSMMKSIYQEWRQYETVEIRLEVVQWINRHNTNKLLDMFSHRKYRKKNIKKLKEEIETLKTKKELEEFV